MLPALLARAIRRARLKSGLDEREFRFEDAPPSLLDALLARRVLPFFSDAEGDGMYSRQVGDSWHRYCAAPQLCHGRETYYWALFDLPGHYFDKLPYAYAQFLKEHAAQERVAA